MNQSYHNLWNRNSLQSFHNYFEIVNEKFQYILYVNSSCTTNSGLYESKWLIYLRPQDKDGQKSCYLYR